MRSMDLAGDEAVEEILRAEPKSPKKERKRLRDRNRPMDSRERARNLWEAVNQGRNLIELADHKARYALVVMGVVNAAVFILATRSHSFIELIPAAVRARFALLLVPFGILAVIFLVDAYNSLRPHPPSLPGGKPGPGDPDDRPLGLLFWEVMLADSVEAYQEAWDRVRMAQLNNELATMAYGLAKSIRLKYSALRRLYIELLIIILFAAVILAVPMYYGLLSNPG